MILKGFSRTQAIVTAAMYARKPIPHILYIAFSLHLYEDLDWMHMTCLHGDENVKNMRINGALAAPFL